MENWGLVIYRETALLFDPLVSSSSNKYMVTLIVAHEIAHTVSQRHLTSRHVTSRHVTACWAGLLGGLFVCCLLGWWAGLVDGWLLVRGAEDDGDDCSGNSMVACLLAACLVAGLVWWMGG